MVQPKRKDVISMAVYKEEKTNTWRVIYRYTDWNGERKQSQNEDSKQNVRLRRGKENNLISLAEIWI